LQAGERSAVHRIRSDEIWHRYDGGELLIEQVAADGQSSVVRLGKAPGSLLQHVVPAGHWFGAAPLPGSDFVLVGCTVAPGFDFADFELQGDRP